RDGALTLIRTEDAQPTDFIPTPDSVTALSRQRLESIDIISYLADTELSVYAEDAVLDYVTAAGNSTFVSVMRAGGRADDSRITIGGEKRSCRLPARLPLTDNVLALFGYYVAEGNSQRRYFTLANYHPAIRARIERGLNELGIPFFVRPSSDYAVAS